MREIDHEERQVERSYLSNVSILKGEAGLSHDSVLLGCQIRAISKSRLLQHRGSLSSEVMQLIDRALRITLDL